MQICLANRMRRLARFLTHRTQSCSQLHTDLSLVGVTAVALFGTNGHGSDYQKRERLNVCCGERLQRVVNLKHASMGDNNDSETGL